MGQGSQAIVTVALRLRIASKTPRRQQLTPPTRHVQRRQQVAVVGRARQLGRRSPRSGVVVLLVGGTFLLLSTRAGWALRLVELVPESPSPRTTRCRAWCLR